MAKVSEIVEPYFSHDVSSRQDRSIILLLDEMGYEGYGLFWAVVEFMHRNKLRVGEERLIAGKEYAEKITKILNDFELFRIENGEYISDRILRNINKQTEKSKKASAAAAAKWAMSSLKSAHIEVFGIEPILNDDEIKIFLDYTNKIPNLKDRLCDILYTTQKLKFENKPDFKGSINWLLRDTHLTQMLNGGFGDLKNWQAHKDYLAKKEQENNQPRGLGDDDFDINTVSSKTDAIELVLSHSSYFKAQKKFIVNPQYSGLIEKFDLSKTELRKMKLERMSEQEQESQDA